MISSPIVPRQRVHSLEGPTDAIIDTGIGRIRNYRGRKLTKRSGSEYSDVSDIRSFHRIVDSKSISVDIDQKKVRSSGEWGVFSSGLDANWYYGE